MIKADLVIKNADILTLDKEGTTGGSLTTYNGRITGIWTEKEPPASVVNRTENVKEIDLQGATLLPGFIDTHNHLLMYARYKLQADCTSPLNQNISDLQGSIAAFIGEKKKEEWIVGFGYDDTLLMEKRHPTKHDLDAVSSDHPIFIRHISGHLAVVNSAALKLAGLDKDTPQPDGGYIGKDESGELTGVLYEPGAMKLVSKHISVPEQDTLIGLIKEAVVDYLAEGITTNTDAGVGLFLGEGELDVHIRAVNEKANPMKMRLMISNHLLTGDGPFNAYTAKELDREIQKKSNGKVKLDSAKLFQDGSIQGLTGALRKPYHCDAQLYGDLIFDQKTLNEFALDFHNRGFRIATHGNGDRAIESVIEAYEYAIENGEQREHRHRIEHVQTASNEDLEKMCNLGIAASFFINHVYYWGDRHRDIFLGPERAERMNPLQDANRLNMLYTLHSDCPITPISPLFSVWAAVNRVTRNGTVLGDSQKITVESALKSMTIYGAQLNFEEEEMGSIEVGKVADFAVLAENPIKVDPMRIKDIEVLATIIDGEIVYEKQTVGIL